jgi:muscarinic acetylcholine receptor M3
MATNRYLVLVGNDSGLSTSGCYDIIFVATAATADDLSKLPTGDASSDVDDGGYSPARTFLVSLLVTVLSLLTAGGNLLVIVAFGVDRRLQTVSNYFLLSLSIADLGIGVVSMPLYTVYLMLDRWPLGPVVCDVWLSVDYTVSNASVASLLIISFDRYFSVTRPLTYRARRTPRRAVVLIAAAWTVSAALWTPWIVAWPYIEGGRSVPSDKCYIQFLATNRYLTLATACAAFYLPVGAMCFLYRRIYHETMERQRRLVGLQGSASSSFDSGAKDELSRPPLQTGCFRSATGGRKEFHNGPITKQVVHVNWLMLILRKPYGRVQLQVYTIARASATVHPVAQETACVKTAFNHIAGTAFR